MNNQIMPLSRRPPYYPSCWHIIIITIIVSKSVQQVAQPAFFLRIAERAEMAPDDDQKVAFERLAAQVRGALGSARL